MIEFALALFFSKLVNYTFLYWLPTFLKETGKTDVLTNISIRCCLIAYHFENTLSLIHHFHVGVNVSGEEAAQISTYFDIGSIIGGIVAGLAVDLMGASASVCTIMLLASLPLVRKENKRVSLCGESNIAGNRVFL